LALKGEYRIHGTDIDKIYGIGMQITHGCIRLYPENIEALYDLVSEGTPVYLVKQPIKVGWLDNKLYIEAHPDLEGDETTHEQRFALALSLIMKSNKGELPDFDKAALDHVLSELRGIPTAIYERLPPLEDEVVPDVVSAPAPVTKTPAKLAVNKTAKQAVVSKKPATVANNKPAKPAATTKATNKTTKSSSSAKTTSKTPSPGYYRGSL
jgi:L,D-transpeptidase ErfK/SrfK